MKEKELNTKAKLEQDIITYLNQIDTNNSNLFFHSFEEIKEDDPNGDANPYYILTLYGGLNGNGKLLFYMEDIEKLIKKLMIRFTNVWLINWTNDCPDDVFDISIGLRL